MQGGFTRRDLMRASGLAVPMLSLPRLLLAADDLRNSSWGFSRFEDVAKAAGLTDSIVYGQPDRATYIVEITGAGCAFLDYDNDGWLDIFVLGGRTLEGIPSNGGNRLYRNNRDGTFTDVTELSGLKEAGWANGVCIGDFNNDGFEDVFITYYGHNKLFRNNGDGTFDNITHKAGLAIPETRFGSGCTFVDYNRDGLLDLFVANYVDIDLATAPKPSLELPNFCNFEGVPINCGPVGLAAPRNFLYRNNGDGTFTDVSEQSGIAGLKGSYALTAVTFDADEDGWPDIFVACDGTPSYLLMNNHDGTFREEALKRGIAVSGYGQAMGGMGVGVGDYDLDGHIDVVKTHFSKQATGIYHNDGKGEFEDMTGPSGLSSERRFISWGVGLVDFDNDGFPDLMIVNGTVYPELEAVYPTYQARNPRLLYRNKKGVFTRLEDGGSCLQERYVSRGCAFGDFDNDGDMDVLIMNRNAPPSLLRNDTPKRNHWIKVRLEGTKSNRSAIGARVVVHYGERLQVQCVTSQASYLSSHDPRLHFGLGQVQTVDIEVCWPNGTREELNKVASDQLVSIREGSGIVNTKRFLA